MRVFIVSNRLPVTIEKIGKNFIVKTSIGGLAKGLQAFLSHYSNNMDMVDSQKFEYTWVGWPGINISDLPHEKREELEQKLESLNCCAVNIPKNVIDSFYSGFCNKTIWPLFHNLTTYFSYDESDWEIYQQVNMHFCETIASMVKPGDIVWVHDYHLFLLPEYLRNKTPQLGIGFFLHIPFPSFETFQFLPKKCRTKLLNGILGSDLVGFHIHDYAQNFTKCVNRMVGYKHDFEFISTSSHLVKVDVYPMGIDFAGIQMLMKTETVSLQKETLLKSINVENIILSIDRLDYTKGIINRLYGYREFLLNNSQWHKKVSLLLLIAPSRENVSFYKKIKRQIDEMVGQINGTFGTIKWAPIIYQYKSFSSQELVAFYSISQIALITPLMDGMNLIAKEFIASKTDNPGVLILSETAGAAKELMDAILVNPMSTEEIALSINEALTMQPLEKLKRFEIMSSRVKRYNVTNWGMSFIKDLCTMKDKQLCFATRFITSKQIKLLLSLFNKAQSRLLIFDYDGTLVPLQLLQNEYQQNRLNRSSLIDRFKYLTQDRRNKIIIISGRSSDILGSIFAGLDLTLIAEHGAVIKNSGNSNTWHTLNIPPNKKLQNTVGSLLESFADKLPGSTVEKKQFSVVWHYRGTDERKAPRLVAEAIDTLMALAGNSEIKVMHGHKLVEIKYTNMNKSIVSKYIKDEFEFILAIGDDVTDEDMFKILPENAFSIKVGADGSYARFNVQSQKNVVDLIDQMVETTNNISTKM